MKRYAKILLFVICLTAAFLVSVAIANAQVAPVKNSSSVKNILSEIVRAKGGNNPFARITPDLVKQMSMTTVVAGPCDTAIPISIGQTTGGALSNTDCLLDDGSYADFIFSAEIKGSR